MAMIPMTQEQVMGLIRHAVTFFGGVLAAKGWLDAAWLNTIAAVVATLGGMAWSVLVKAPEQR